MSKGLEERRGGVAALAVSGRRGFLRSLLVAIPAGLPGGDLHGQEANAPTARVWRSKPPGNCPFPQSKDIAGIAFTGRHSDYKVADTWYPSWASDGRLYSPWTDGTCPRLDGSIERSDSSLGARAQTGQAVLEGDDPLNLKIYSLGLVEADASPYLGRYPCGSLVVNGVWYYGTYTLAPQGKTRYWATPTYNWPWLGPVVGFRVSTDYGRTWKETPHTPEKALFGETRDVGPSGEDRGAALRRLRQEHGTLTGRESVSRRAWRAARWGPDAAVRAI